MHDRRWWTPLVLALLLMAATPARAEAEDLTLWWGPIPETDQEGFFDDDTPDATLILQGGYASGKTMTLVAKMLKLSAINAPIPIIWTVPDWGHVEDTILETLQSRDDDNDRPWFLEPHEFQHNLRKHRLDWIGGGPILFASASNPDSIAGPNVAAAGTDEPGKIKHAAWRNTCARVRHPSAKLRQIVAAGTPEGLNWLADVVDDERPDNVHVYRVDTDQNSELLSKHAGYLDQVRANATEAELEAYLHGKVTNMLGSLAYPVFDSRIHYRPDIALDPRLPLRVCFDFNVDPLCGIIAQHAPGPAGAEIRVITSEIRYNGTTEKVVNAIAERFGCWVPGYEIYGDATGQSRSVYSNESNYDIIRKRLERTGAPVRFHVPRANPAVALRLNSVNALLRNALGQVRVAIKRHDPRATCPNRELVRSLQRTTIKPGTKEVVKKPGETITHPAEALGYYLAAEFPSQSVSQVVATIKAGQRPVPASLPSPAHLDRQILEITEQVIRYGSVAVTKIRRLTEPTFLLPEHLRGIPPGGHV